MRLYLSTKDEPKAQLPRGWQRVCHETGLLLKSLGLGIILSTVQGIQKGFLEPRKIAVQESRLTAFFKSLFHVAPFAVALTEVTLNFKSHYISESFE